MKKILIGGTNSGVGKTTISIGIMKALKNRGLNVQPYKVGPDYIDTTYHTFVTNRESRNLDSYMLEDEVIKCLFSKNSIDVDISVVEGVMGLYDGYGVDINSCTSSYTSKILECPVILVIDGKAMATSSAAMVLGYKELDKDVDIRGVIVNNISSEGHFAIIKESIEKYCDIEVLGYLPKNKDFSLPSRHLGLVPSIEMEELNEKFDKLADLIEKHINLDRLIEISESKPIYSNFKLNIPKFNDLTLALAYDKAFNFYYQDNIDLLEDMGVNIIKFSPLYDKELPSCDCIYIGGGFPEIFAKELQGNINMRKSIKDAYKKNIPIYAECGGLMYLGEKLVNQDNSEFDMVGIFNGKSVMTKSLKRFGYCTGEALEDTVLSQKGDKIRGHEFHHSEFISDEKCVYLMKKEREGIVSRNWMGGYSKSNTLATYLHTHFYSNLNTVINFLGKGIQ
ncbi:MAG TPA: cobyrinate a,c-diamide synthase [Peptostreptococcaceae bacterium]|nr:cobyrinate a,c-diamide synthase [Peptostreptococcaceae bacterium]